jgi:hypothetical protein
VVDTEGEEDESSDEQSSEDDDEGSDEDEDDEVNHGSKELSDRNIDRQLDKTTIRKQMKPSYLKRKCPKGVVLHVSMYHSLLIILFTCYLG